MAAEVQTVKDPALKYGLEFGVAFLHDIMRPEDRVVAERLFAAGAVQVIDTEHVRKCAYSLGQ